MTNGRRFVLSDHHHDYIYWFDEFGDRYYPGDTWTRWLRLTRISMTNGWTLPCNSWTCSYPLLSSRMNLCRDTGNDRGMLWNALQRKHWKNEVRWRAKSKRIDTCSHDPCDPKEDTALRCSKCTSTHTWKRGLLQELQCQVPRLYKRTWVETHPIMSPCHFPGRQFLDWSICSKPLTETFGRNDCVFRGVGQY